MAIYSYLDNDLLLIKLVFNYWKALIFLLRLLYPGLKILRLFLFQPIIFGFLSIVHWLACLVLYSLLWTIIFIVSKLKLQSLTLKHMIFLNYSALLNFGWLVIYSWSILLVPSTFFSLLQYLYSPFKVVFYSWLLRVPTLVINDSNYSFFKSIHSLDEVSMLNFIYKASHIISSLYAN